MNSCPVCFHKISENATTCNACGFSFVEFEDVLADLPDPTSIDGTDGQENDASTSAGPEVPENESFVTPVLSDEKKIGLPFVACVFILIICAAVGLAWWISGSEKNPFLDVSKENTDPIAEMAILAVTSEPTGATLYIEEKVVGETPFQDKKIEPGKRILRFEKKYYEPLVESIDLQADKVTQYHAVLENALGELTILTQPLGASISIDGVEQDTKTPVTFQEVSAGKRKVLVRMDRYYDSEKIVEVLPDTVSKIDIILPGGNLEKYEGKWLEPVEAQNLRLKKQEARKRADELAAKELEKKRLAQKQKAERLAKIREEERRQEAERLAILREEERRQEVERLAILREARKLEEAKVRVDLQELEKDFQKGVSLEKGGMIQKALKQFKFASRNFKKTTFPIGILKGQRIDLQRRISEGEERVIAGEFVKVPGGCFQMGCGDWAGTCDSDEKPVHEVCVESFSIGKYEVTQGHWQLLMDYNFSQSEIGKNYPVDNVSWEEVQEYLQKLNIESDSDFRLPTEAEWEYACRSGGKEEKYCGGNFPDDLAWYEKNSSIGTHPVGTLAPNGLGIYDMSGNVWEWCEDRYGEKYYGRSPENDPTGPTVGPLRVIRGGSWGGSAMGVCSTYRSRNWPNYNGQFQGFRLVKSTKQ